MIVTLCIDNIGGGRRIITLRDRNYEICLIHWCIIYGESINYDDREHHIHLSSVISNRGINY